MPRIKPSDITTIASRNPPRWEGWVPTFTGEGLQLLDPHPEDIRIEDIAQGLAYKYRYGGQALPVTVAEHCLLVSQIIRTLWPESDQGLAGLMHDAAIAYTPDVPAPVRKYVKVQLRDGEVLDWKALESKFNEIIAKALHMEPKFWGRPEVKAANILATSIEKSQCSILQRGNWKLPTVPDEIKGLKVQLYTPEVAKQTFLDMHKLLVSFEDVSYVGVMG